MKQKFPSQIGLLSRIHESHSKLIYVLQVLRTQYEIEIVQYDNFVILIQCFKNGRSVNKKVLPEDENILPFLVEWAANIEEEVKLKRLLEK